MRRTLIAGSAIALWMASSATQARSRASMEQIQQFIAQIRDGPMGVRNHAAQRLYLLQDPRGNRAILARSRDPSPQVRATFTWALSVVRPPGTKAALRRGLRDQSAAVRRAAAIAVGALRLRQGPRWLRRLLTDSDRHVRGAVIASLVRFGKRSIPLLGRALRCRLPDVQLLAIKALGQLRHPRADRHLRRVARRGRSELLRQQAAHQLVQRNDSVGPEILCLLLHKGREKGVRLQAASSLARDGSSRGERCLRKGLSLGDAEIQHAAWSALAERKAATNR